MLGKLLAQGAVVLSKLAKNQNPIYSFGLRLASEVIKAVRKKAKKK